MCLFECVLTLPYERRANRNNRTVSDYTLRQKLIEQRRHFFNYSAIGHVCLVIITFLMAKVENYDAINAYYSQLKQKVTDDPTFDPKVSIDGPNKTFRCFFHLHDPGELLPRRPIIFYLSIMALILSLFTALFTTLSYKNYFKLLCVTNSATLEAKMWLSSDVILSYIIEVTVSLSHPACYLRSVE